MPRQRAILTATSGPNAGDSVTIELGTCRLIGRHLSENETSFIGRDGNRFLDDSANEILQQHLKHRAPPRSDSAPRFANDAFERGSDIVFGDDSISRAHAMVFYDSSGFGIIDLASTNGTFVNGERVASAILEDGDAVAIGASELAVKLR